MKKNYSLSFNFLNSRFHGTVVTIVLCVNILLNHSVLGQLAPWQEKKVDSLFAQWNNQQTPGMEVMILHKGKVLMEKSYGLANIDRRIPHSSKGRIWVASMSKQFTALAIALLVDNKKISLEDDIRRYLPELPFLGDTIKIKNLVYHTSGLRDGFVLTAMSFKPEDEYSNQNVLTYLSRQKGRNFKPGERFEYNNGGYVLLATIVERVSGQAFPDFVHQRIFAPLHMDDSEFYGRFPVKDSGIVTGYSINIANGKTMYQPAYFKGHSYGSTGLVTTAADLAKWDRVFYEPVFGKKVQQLQLRTGKLNNGQSVPYGFGLEIENFKGKTAITHSGADAGYKSEIVRFLREEFTVICLANTEDAYNSTDRLFKVASLFIDFRKASRPAFAGECEPGEGVYINKETLASMRFVKSGNPSKVSTGYNGNGQTLIQQNKCEYAIKDIETDLYTFRGNRLHHITRANNEVYHKISKSSPPQTALKEMKGAYYSEELGVSYNLFEKEGVLYLKFFDVYDVPLTPYEGELFVGEFLGTNVLHFVKGPSGNIIGIEFHREGIHGLFFSRKS